MPEVSINEANPGVSRNLIVTTTLNDATARNGINQIRGQSSKGSLGSGIPRQVTNVGASIATGAVGTTSTVRVTFHRDPSDQNYSAAAVWVKGYQGNNNPVQVAQSYESPATFVLNNTGEPVGIIVQSTGNGGQAPLSSSPTTGLRLPKSSVSGYGTGTTTAYTPNSPPPSTGLTLSTAGQGWFIGAGGTDLADTVNGFNAALTNRSANVVVVQQFVLQSTWTLSSVSYKLHSGNAGDHFNFGIYDSSGNKKIDSTAFDGSITTAQTKSFAATTLVPGVYYFAVSATSTSFTGPTMQVGTVTITDFLGAFTVTTPFVGTATNTTSSNVLPSTLGVITAATASWFQGMPLCVWQV